MFQVNCPECRGLIKSPLLVELETIECSGCHEHIKVADITVKTKKFTIQRSDLLNNVPYYKNLLRDVEKELQELHAKGAETVKVGNATNFWEDIKELLLGARDNYRLTIPFDLYVEISFDGTMRLARLINLSSSGAAVELMERGQLPPCPLKLQMNLLLPEHAEPFTLAATAVWSRNVANGDDARYVQLGVHFDRPDERAHAHIWDFIRKNGPPTH